jgi:cobaltochelatase CobN
VPDAASGRVPVQGLRLEPVPELPTRATPPVVQGLWAAFGVAVLVALGALSQWRRGRRAVPA